MTVDWMNGTFPCRAVWRLATSN